jgi:hypothetical protein
MAYKLVSHVIDRQRFFVYKINDISFHERLFCIFDTEKPYRLSLMYRELSKSTGFTPVIGVHGKNVIHEKTEFEKVYNFRMSTAEECKYHINEVQEKKKLIDEMIIGFTEDMMLEHNRKMLNKLNNFQLRSRKNFKV